MKRVQRSARNFRVNPRRPRHGLGCKTRVMGTGYGARKLPVFFFRGTGRPRAGRPMGARAGAGGRGHKRGLGGLGI